MEIEQTRESHAEVRKILRTAKRRIEVMERIYAQGHEDFYGVPAQPHRWRIDMGQSACSNRKRMLALSRDFAAACRAARRPSVCPTVKTLRLRLDAMPARRPCFVIISSDELAVALAAVLWGIRVGWRDKLGWQRCETLVQQFATPDGVLYTPE